MSSKFLGQLRFVLLVLGPNAGYHAFALRKTLQELKIQTTEKEPTGLNPTTPTSLSARKNKAEP